MAISEKQKRFVREWMIDMNQTRAAIRAGYAEKTAAVTASRLMKLPEVQEYRNALLKEEYESLGITRHTLAVHAAELFSRCFEGKEHLSWNPVTKSYEPDGTWCMDTNGAVKALKIQLEMLEKLEHKDAPATGGGLEELMKALEDK